MPDSLGTNQHGRDNVSYLSGIVPQFPLSDWIWRQDVRIDAGNPRTELHRVCANFDTSDAVWQSPLRQPAEDICHNDFAPYNMVFTGQRLSGVVDWDMASAGPRAWDPAYHAFRLVPLTHPDNSDAINTDLPERARRLDLLCHTYGSDLDAAGILPVAVGRLHDLAAFTEARADQGQEHLREHVALYRRDAQWITTHAPRLHHTVA